MNIPKFPEDENGDALRRMYKSGDDLDRPRIIDFCFVFPEWRQALVFADIVDERDFEIWISYYKEREMWQAIVKRYMASTHQGISGH